MKPEIHPKYYEKSTVKCACGSTLTVGATKPDIAVEICGKCHPFYTGKEKMIDTAGKVEKFKARREKAAANSSAVRRPKKEKRAEKTKAQKAKK